MTLNAERAVQGSTADIVESFRNRTFQQLIDGHLVTGASTQFVTNPSTGEPFTQAPVADATQVDAAVAAASRAFPAWSTTTVDERAQVVRSLISQVEERYEEIAQVIALEVGKPISASRTDVDLALMWAKDVVDDQLSLLEPTIVRDTAEERIEVHHRPSGVVAAIVPWNFPFFQTMYKVVPALITGNTVVVKPSPTTPLNGMLLAEILAPLIPAGVVNVVGDAGEVGPLLTSHQDVRHVSFTGSTAAGRKVAASGASTLKRIVLELGGNDAAIVMPDADIEKAADGVFTFAFTNSGQVCINIKRIFVPRSLHDEFVQALAKRADAAVVGDALDADTELGPIQNARQFETVKGFLETAKRDGTIVAGGSVIDRPGYFVQPTVVTQVDADSTLIHEETFGPIRSVIAYDDLDEAVRRVNDTSYGLGNSVWGTDVDRAAQVARRLESGTVWVNNHFALAPDVPFGGQKQSGMGAEFGIDGLLAFTETQVVNITK